MHRISKEFALQENSEDFINIGTQLSSYDYVDNLWTFVYNCISIIKSLFFIGTQLSSYDYADNLWTFVYNCISIIKSLFFIGNMFMILVSEALVYVICQDYKTTIGRVTRRLAAKNILYVKMFQAFALNKNLIDETINKEIIKYSDCVPYTFDDIDWNTLYSIVDNYNLEIEEPGEPINSGMISLVFKLKSKDNGKTLILKLKRQYIEYKLNEGIDRIKFLVYLVSFIPWFNTLEIPLLFNRNIEILKEQLDFKREIQNTIEMKEVCKINDFIKIPQIVEGVNDLFPNAILMEYIDGCHLSKVEPEDYYEFSKLVFKYGCINIVSHGLFHGDLHSGNILFIKNGEEQVDIPKYQIGIIDFGIVMRISAECKKGFFKIFTELFTSDPREFAVLIFDNLLEPKGILNDLPIEHKTNILNIIENLITPLIKKTKKLDQGEFFEFILHFNEYLSSENLKTYGITVNDEFIKMQMGIAMAHGISIVLCKDNIMDLVKEVLNEIFHLDVMMDLLEEDD
jgi:predicted unusual protein kinase regulating ubiquinone biosynthesis (AarF/ABC1/UbiB family)